MDSERLYLHGLLPLSQRGPTGASALGEVGLVIRIYERVEVVDDGGNVVRVFTREMDPASYVVIAPDIGNVEWAQRTRKMTERQATEFERLAVTQPGDGK